MGFMKRPPRMNARDANFAAHRTVDEILAESLQQGEQTYRADLKKYMQALDGDIRKLHQQRNEIATLYDEGKSEFLKGCEAAWEKEKNERLRPVFELISEMQTKRREAQNELNRLESRLISPHTTGVSPTQPVHTVPPVQPQQPQATATTPPTPTPAQATQVVPSISIPTPANKRVWNRVWDKIVKWQRERLNPS
jgi:hypothetical protein